MAKTKAANSPAAAGAKKRKVDDTNAKKTSDNDARIDKADPDFPFDVPHDSEEASLSPAERLHRLLEPHTKDKLISLLVDAAAADRSVLSRILSFADADVSHRKIFIYGLGWDVTRDQVVQALAPFGPIEDCNLVTDRVTGRAKGYCFVIFRSRADALKALKSPQKKIGSRFTTCQLASTGPVPNPAGPGSHLAGRRVYITGVKTDDSPEKLRAFFSKFGELEAGPMGFDVNTGKSRGYAIFIYRTVEGARKCLEDPHKPYDGHHLHCQLANEIYKGKAPVAAPPALPNVGAAAAGAQALLGAASQPLLAAAAAQSLAILAQNPAAYAAVLAQNPLLAAAALNPAAAMMLNQAPGLAQAYGGGAAVPSMLGSYGVQSYQGAQFGQSSTGAAAPKPGSSLGGYPTYLQ